MKNKTSSHIPVVIIHGYLATKEMMVPLKSHFEKAGFRTYTADLPPFNLGDIRLLTLKLHQNIKEILAECGAQQCDLVGASLGGLIGLYYLKKMDGHNWVRRFIALGCPFKGTWAALAGIAALGLISKGSWQTLPQSPFLKDLEEGDLPEGVECISIYAKGDPISPPERSVLEGAENMEIEGLPFPIVHQSLIFSDGVFEKIKEVLDR